MIWALILLIGDVGNAIGTALATNLWQHFLPLRLKEQLGSLLSEDDIKAVFSSTETATSYPEGSEISKEAYIEVMALLLYVALGFAILSFVLSFLIGDAAVAEKIDPRIAKRDRWRKKRLEEAHARSAAEDAEEEEKERRRPRDVQHQEVERTLLTEETAMALGKKGRRGRRRSRRRGESTDEDEKQWLV
ncbi:hypothetical protein JCM6882_007938 [Rhodosporidiobolus microsporus]